VAVATLGVWLLAGAAFAPSSRRCAVRSAS
jgi:hypothetical protein